MDSTTSKVVHAGISENRAASSVELARPDRDDATQERANPPGGQLATLPLGLPTATVKTDSPAKKAQ